MSGIHKVNYPHGYALNVNPHIGTGHGSGGTMINKIVAPDDLFFIRVEDRFVTSEGIPFPARAVEMAIEIMKERQERDIVQKGSTLYIGRWRGPHYD